MGLEHWEQDRAELQVVLDALNSGQLQLKQGQDEYIASLNWRLRYLDEKLKRSGKS